MELIRNPYCHFGIGNMLTIPYINYKPFQQLIRSISLNREEPTKSPTPLRRAESLRAERNRRKDSLYWTMNLEQKKEEQGNLPVQRELNKRVSSRRKSKFSILMSIASAE